MFASLGAIRLQIVCTCICILHLDAYRKEAYRKSATTISLKSTPYQKYINEYNEGLCKPMLWQTKCEGDKYRGILIYFHGFGGCADQFDELAPRMTEICWDVMVPVNPGHSRGGGFIPCSTGNCTQYYNGTHGFDMSDYPATSGYEYKQHANDMRDLALKEKEWRNEQLGNPKDAGSLAVMGMSLGAAISYRAMVDEPNAFSRMLLVNPFFGNGQEGEDLPLRRCNDEVIKGTKTDAECATEAIKQLSPKYGGGWFARQLFQGGSAGYARQSDMKIMRNLAHTLPKSLSAKFMGGLIRWGGKCTKIVERGATGSCIFQQRHFVAMHTFALNALDAKLRSSSDTTWLGNSDELKVPTTQVVLTEVDGVTRTGLGYAAAKHLHCYDPNAKVSSCMFPFQEGKEELEVADPGYFNTINCVPHAVIGQKENLQKDRWWEPKFGDWIVDFMAGKSDSLNSATPWEKRDKTQCVGLPLSDDALSKPSVRHAVLPEADPAWKDEC